MSERHETMTQPPQPGTPIEEFLRQALREGRVRGIPTRRVRTESEQAEFEALSRLFDRGTPVAELVREDRGSLLP